MKIFGRGKTKQPKAPAAASQSVIVNEAGPLNNSNLRGLQSLNDSLSSNLTGPLTKEQTAGVMKKMNEKPIEKLGKVPFTKADFPESMSRSTCKPLEQDLGSMVKVPEEVLEMCVQPDALSSSPAAATPTAATAAAATAVSGGAASGAAGGAPGLVGP